MATYEPNYLYWYEKDFSSDTYVSRVMRPLHRHFYRALIIASCFNSERPYLPNDDEQLWILADAESLEQWLAHKDVVLRKFTLTTDEKYWQHKRILKDWQRMLDAHTERSEAGKRGGAKKASNAKRAAGSATAPPSSAIAPSSSAQAPSSTTQHNTVLDFTIQKQNTHTQERVCESLSSFSQVAKWLETEMKATQKKKGEKEQIEALIAKHGGAKFIAVQKLFWQHQPAQFEKTIFKWTALLEAFDSFLDDVTPEMLEEQREGRWRKEHPEEYQRQIDASVDEQRAEVVKRMEATPVVAEDPRTPEEFMAGE